MHRAIDLSMTHRHMETYICLKCKLQSDIEWWFQMATAWNGASILAQLQADSHDGAITSDASGGWSCGAFHGLESEEVRHEWCNVVQLIHST